MAATDPRTATQAQWEDLVSRVKAKQDELTAGTGITIDNNVVSTAQQIAEFGIDISTADTAKYKTSSYDNEDYIEFIIKDGSPSADSVVVEGSIDQSVPLATVAYMNSQISSAIGDITSFEYEVVQSLPQTGEKGVIYLVPNSGSTPNIYDEYIYVNNAFEKIGTTEMDLSNYYTKTQTDTLLANKADSSNLSTVATSGSYNDLTNKPTIPTVNDATLTIQNNGTTVGTFSANASTNATVNIATPSEFTSTEWNNLWA